jgi:hypothetical protein
LHACIELHLEKGHDGIDNAVLYACEILHQLCMYITLLRRAFSPFSNDLIGFLRRGK